MHDHRERAVDAAAALDDGIRDGLVLRGQLLLAAYLRESCHVPSPLVY
jgi:hypothetical protein